MYRLIITAQDGSESRHATDDPLEAEALAGTAQALGQSALLAIWSESLDRFVTVPED